MGAIPDSWWCSFHFSVQRIPTQEAQYSSEVKGTRNCKTGDDRERPLTIWLQASAIIPSRVQFSHPLPLSKRQPEQRRTTAIHLHLFFLPPWEALLGSCHGDNGAMSNTGHCTEAPENQCWPCWKCFRGWFIVLKEKMGIWPEWGKHCKVRRGSLGWSLSAFERKIPIVLGHTRDSRREWRLCLWPASSEIETLMVVAEHHLLHWLSQPGWKMILNRNHYDIT